MTVKNKIAIIIPYYKLSYFNVLLDALLNQTNKNFNLYVGDDCSVSSPLELIAHYRNKLNINYKRFDKNLGSISLAKQWERCLGMVGDEEWVWVLPDDDVPSSNVVEAFYIALSEVEIYNIKVFRLPLKFIDGKNMPMPSQTYSDPQVENNLDFYMRLLKGETDSTLGDNIFHKETLEKSGGFVDFPKAWGSDHATVLNVSAGGNLYLLENTFLSFRMSGENISSDMSDGVEKLKSRIAFAKWLKTNEHIFPKKPDSTFWKFFYWKGEYYVLNEWKFSLNLWKELYTLRKMCFYSSNILPLLKILFKKLFVDKK